MGFVSKRPISREVPFDNSTNGFTATEAQSAIEEVNARVASAASPGYTFGRSGSLSAGTWLQQESVPSNVAGRAIGITNGKIEEISIANEDVSTFTVEIYEHDGVTFTLLTSASLSAARAGTTNIASVSVTKGKQLAAKISSGSCKNVSVTVIIVGSI